MRHGLVCLGVVVFAGFSATTSRQEKAKDATSATPAAPAQEAAKPTAASERKNPVKLTPEGLASAKKMFGYDCAMCHGLKGDGKGDVGESMKLTMKSWSDPSVIDAVSDGEMYDLIVKGKDKMIGEGTRLSPEQAWNMVHYVRSLAKREGAAAKETAAPPKS